MLSNDDLVDPTELTAPGQFDVFLGVPLRARRPVAADAVDNLTETVWYPDGPCWS